MPGLPGREEIRHALAWTLRDLYLLPGGFALRQRHYHLPPQGGYSLLAYRGALQQMLYETCYTRRLSETAFDRWVAPTVSGPDTQLVDSLTRVTGADPRWDGGWRPAGPVEGEGTWLAKGEVLRWARHGGYVADTVPGFAGFVWLLAEREWREPKPGFHFVAGRTPGDAREEARPARFYLHTRASTVSAVSGLVVETLDAYDIPFRYKTLNAGALYDRTDASVLYVAPPHAIVVEQLLRDLFQGAADDWLDPAVPLFSRRVVPGIGFAVDPGNGESFGTDRCRMVAEGILDAALRGQGTAEARWSAIEARFAALGVDLDRPHLRAGQTEWM